MRKINKRAMYMSVSVVVILFTLFIIFQNQARVQQAEKDLVSERARIVVMENFMADFGDYYSYVILNTALKPALVEMTKSPGAVSKPGLISVMEGGSGPHGETIPPQYTTQSALGHALASLSFRPEERQFSYSIEEIRQAQYDKFEIVFLVDYSFSFSGNSWSREGLEVTVPVSVYSLSHPSYPTEGTITDEWVSDADGTDCYVRKVFSDSGLECGGSPDIRPPTVLPPPGP